MPRPKGSTNKITAEVKVQLQNLIDTVVSSIDVNSMDTNQKLKLLQLSLHYVLPKLRSTETTEKKQESLSKPLREEVRINGSIGVKFINTMLKSYKNPTSFNAIRRHSNVLLNYLKENGFDVNPTSLKPLKQTEILHKPIVNLSDILEDIRAYNNNLYLCALFTYCCLLRPHREV